MSKASPRVLITPLNWGLGHATRCIPIIRTLLDLQCEVIIAANGAAADLLKEEFPELQHLDTPGTTIHYGRNKFTLLFSLFRQLPALLQQLRKERKWMQEIVSRYQPELIVSDNRYGMYHEAVTSILITHQLGIKTGLGRLTNRILQKFLYSLIQDFDEVWVPDHRGPDSLAGSLSNPKKFPKNPVYYIGPLNRFAQLTAAIATHKTDNNNAELLILLSGPEPQRSLLETLLKKQLVNYSGKVTMLRGLPQKASLKEQKKNQIKPTTDTKEQLPLLYGTPTVEIIDHLPPTELFKKIQSADIVLCRSGYTSLMELMPLQKKLILIPTPGQPEQEYLAKRCKERRLAICTTQNDLPLEELISKAKAFVHQQNNVAPDDPNEQMQQRVRFYLRSLQ